MADLRETFNEDETELARLNQTPISFVIVGKPGSGKSTLAKRLASVWKCQLIDGSSTIEQILKEDSNLAQEVKKVLYSGQELSEALVAAVIKEKLESPEIQHYGYVLDCLPSFVETWKSTEEQIEFLKSLKQSPDVIINIKIPDVDLLKRRVGQRVDPLNNEVFIKAVYDPDSPLTAAEEKEEDEEDEDENNEGSDDEGENDEGIGGDQVTEDEFQDDLGEVDSLHLLAPNIADRLVKRANDKMATVQEEITHYKQKILSHIEDYIIQHNHQYVIELDGCLSSKELFKSLLVRLTALGLPRAIAPKRLVEPEDEETEEEPAEGVETEQFLTQVSGTGILVPQFRWRRSKWRQYCPVELARGNMIKGKLEYSVGLLDKLYCLSSADAMTAFIKCPRKYLMPPSPRLPCKICVLGPPTSGKTTLANALADHYCAMVIDIQELMKPVLEKAMDRAVSEAMEKAKEETIARLTIEQEALASQAQEESTEPVTITADHPEVQAAMEKAAEKAKEKEIEPSVELYIEALSLGIKQAEEKRANTDERLYGGWIVDGFPYQRDHWSFMFDAKKLPDCVLIIDADGVDSGFMMRRFCESKGIADPFKEEEQKKEEVNEETEEKETKKKVKLPPEVEQWQKQTSLFESQWNLLSGAIKGLPTEPIKISPSLSVEDAVQTAVEQMEAVFKFTAADVDEENDLDDDPILDEGGDKDENEEEEEEENEELAAKRRKPWGDSSHFCPVALNDLNVLWPGQSEHALRYREKLYNFSSEEAKDKFAANPQNYVANQEPLKVPSPRIFLLGPRASGKTVVGRLVAEKLGVFHISFREYLQDQIMPKMKRAPLQDPEDLEEDNQDEDEEKQEGSTINNGEELDDDVNEALNERETELRSYLLHGEQLSEETLEEYAMKFWKTEPYRSTGFIMEGLPYHSDELRYLCSKGLYPDATVVLSVDEGQVIERVLPGKLTIWRAKRDKRVEKKRQAREKRLKEWEDDKSERKAEIEEEYKRKKLERERRKKEQDETEDNEEEEEDPYVYEFKEQLAEIDSEEPPEEEEEEEEAEEDVEERMKSALADKYEEQNDTITSIQDVLSEFQIPCHTVSANRKVSIVTYCFEKVLSPYFKNRKGLLTKCTPIDANTAKKLLDHGYKQLSQFSYWCPVKLMEEPHSVLPPSSMKATFPVIYRQRIYFLSSIVFRNQFIDNPESYLRQIVPRLPVPLCLAIVGPPKSGKTTVAERFVNQYGCVRLSIGEAIRKVTAQFPDSDLSEQMMSHLRMGQTLPDELCVLALERALLDVSCSARGYILDGWPLTKAQVDLLNKYRIIPVRIVELAISNETMLKRTELFRHSANRPYPMHDSPSILLTRSGHYYKNLPALKTWYTEQHDNWTVVDGERNCWYVWREIHSVALKTAVQIQQYLIRIMDGKAASINCLCVTPQEFKDRLGSFGEYCPVSYIEKGELVDCFYQPSLEYAVEYKAKYYRIAGEHELKAFLSNPDAYISDEIQLPSSLPCRRNEMNVKEMFPRQFEIKGFCPVTYIDGKKRYKSLVPGNSKWSVEYKGKLYCCASEEKLEKFMRNPSVYEDIVLPVKLPPVRQPLSVVSLPMLGYMEQTVATPIINGLTAVGSIKPKFPFLTATQSALIYLALHLKAYNPKNSTYIREKYRRKLRMFENRCQLIASLGDVMKKGYQEPHERPMEFEGQMTRFLDLVRT